MPAEINYKKKYQALKERYINDLDISFRLGVEQGMQQAQQQQALDAKAQADEHNMNAQLGQSGEDGAPSTEQPGQESTQSWMENPRDSELDQHINKLQSMLGNNSEPEIQKSLEAIISLRKEEKLARDMKKSEQAIASIAKALHKPALKFGIQASHNLTESGKQAVSLQHKIVNDVMKSWAIEEEKASKDIKTILGMEHILED